LKNINSLKQLLFDKSTYKILIVEDSRFLNKLLHDTLVKYGYQCDQAHSLKEAKALLSTSQYDLLILDLHLPDGEGEELIAEIKVLHETKIIILTADEDKMLREHIYSYGVLDYFNKNNQILHTISLIDKLIVMTQYNSDTSILIIQESVFVRKLLSTVLRPRNYKIFTAQTAKEGLKVLEDESIDIVLLDLELPDMQGTEVLNKIKSDKDLMAVHVIILSGSEDPNIVSNVLKSGASAYIRKPFTSEEVINTVDIWAGYQQEKNRGLAQQQALLHEKDKMFNLQSRNASMGEMISMITHQWKQPLSTISSISNYIEIGLDLGTSSPEMLRKQAKTLEEQVAYLSQTIDDFKNFLRPSTEKINTNIADVIETTLNLIGKSITDQGINITREVHVQSTVSIYPNELSQVLVNILKNALDAFSNTNIIDKRIAIRAYEQKSSIIIEIEDNAGGISQGVIEKIFTPYFTTKGEEEGTGLGLYICKRIIQEHMRGKISVKNKKKGASFVIDLPR